MMLQRLIYVSRPFGFNSAMLGGILLGARRNNQRDGLTGALVCREDIYLQLLEGPAEAVGAAFGRIARDDRHCDVEVLVAAPVDARLFPSWDMLDDPARSWLWSPREVAAGAPLASGPAALSGIFARVAAERGASDRPVSASGRATCPAGANA